MDHNPTSANVSDALAGRVDPCVPSTSRRLGDLKMPADLAEFEALGQELLPTASFRMIRSGMCLHRAIGVAHPMGTRSTRSLPGGHLAAMRRLSGLISYPL